MTDSTSSTTMRQTRLMCELKKFMRSDCGAMALVAGVLLVVIGGTMAVLGGFVGFTIHEAIRYEAITNEHLGNMTSNTTTFTVTWEPISDDHTITLLNNSDCVTGACQTGASTMTTPCGNPPCFNVTSYKLGTLHVDVTRAGSALDQVITASYYGVLSGTDLSEIYDKFMKALLILGIAMIVVGASVIFRELRDLG